MPSSSAANSLEALRARIAAIERGGSPKACAETLSLGLEPIEGALGGGLRLGCLHEATGSGADGFVAALVSRLRGPILWCNHANANAQLYPPGLKAFGIDPGHLILVRCRNRAELLSAMEEGLRSSALSAVIGEATGSVDLTASRRLQLAAETGGGAGFLLLRGGGDREPSAAFTRWRIDHAPPPDSKSGCIYWRVELDRCRGSGRGAWTVAWHAKTGHFTLVSEAGDGQAEPAKPRRMAG